MRFPNEYPDSALGREYGARLMDSTPPAMYTSPSPALIARAAWLMAFKPEAHRRFTVTPPTSTGRPASRAAIRATLRLSSPAWFAHPKKTSSTSAGSSSIALDNFLDHKSSHIVRTNRSENPTQSADRRTDRIHDDNFCHFILQITLMRRFYHLQNG